MLTAAQPQPVQVPNSCFAGKAFTIKIPVRLPANTSGEYEWYRNDTLIAGTRATLAAGVTTISYTIPANKAFGDLVLFHFKYNVYESGGGSCGEWTTSRKYAVTFLLSDECTLTGADSIACDDVVLSCQLSGGGSIECDNVSLSCQLSSGGSIECDNVSLSCQLSNGGSIECD